MVVGVGIVGIAQIQLGGSGGAFGGGGEDEQVGAGLVEEMGEVLEVGAGLRVEAGKSTAQTGARTAGMA